jgi:hypothetical protein
VSVAVDLVVACRRIDSRSAASPSEAGGDASHVRSQRIAVGVNQSELNGFPPGQDTHTHLPDAIVEVIGIAKRGDSDPSSERGADEDSAGPR